MTDVIVSVGMGPGQLAFIKRLRELGYHVIAFGKGNNSEEAEKLCLHSANLDTHSSKEVIEWIDSLDVNVIGVGSFAGGQAIHTVQDLSNYYKVSTAIPEDLVVGPSKDNQQSLLEKYKLSSIQTWMCKELTEKTIISDRNNYYIIKPAVGRGSEGICYVNKEQLISRIIQRQFSDEDIVQNVIHGREYRTVIIVQNGEIKLLAPVLRKSYRETVFLGILSYEERDYKRLFSFIHQFIVKSQIRNSILKADIIVSDNSIDVIEIDIGVGGGSYYKTFVSKLYNCNLMDEYIHLITGDKVNSFSVYDKYLRMEYVFNHREYAVSYDINECAKELNEHFGQVDILVNQLHPESKGGYKSNADFIFTVIYSDENANEDFRIDTFVNDKLLH